MKPGDKILSDDDWRLLPTGTEVYYCGGASYSVVNDNGHPRIEEGELVMPSLLSADAEWTLVSLPVFGSPAEMVGARKVPEPGFAPYRRLLNGALVLRDGDTVYHATGVYRSRHGETWVKAGTLIARSGGGRWTPIVDLPDAEYPFQYVSPCGGWPSEHRPQSQIANLIPPSIEAAMTAPQGKASESYSWTATLCSEERARRDREIEAVVQGLGQRAQEAAKAREDRTFVQRAQRRWRKRLAWANWASFWRRLGPDDGRSVTGLFIARDGVQRLSRCGAPVEHFRAYAFQQKQTSEAILRWWWETGLRPVPPGTERTVAEETFVACIREKQEACEALLHETAADIDEAILRRYHAKRVDPTKYGQIVVTADFVERVVVAGPDPFALPKDPKGRFFGDDPFPYPDGDET